MEMVTNKSVCVLFVVNAITRQLNLCLCLTVHAIFYSRVKNCMWSYFLLMGYFFNMPNACKDRFQEVMFQNGFIHIWLNQQKTWRNYHNVYYHSLYITLNSYTCCLYMKVIVEKQNNIIVITNVYNHLN